MNVYDENISETVATLAYLGKIGTYMLYDK